MAAGKVIGFALLGAIAGAVAGGVAGLGLGLAYTTLAQTSSFEGYSGFVVGFWMLGGIFVGLLAGLVYGGRRGMG
jgi:hypothetical protein